MDGREAIAVAGGEDIQVGEWRTVNERSKQARRPPTQRPLHHAPTRADHPPTRAERSGTADFSQTLSLTSFRRS